ncbi:MAG: MBL fold metallo-hydrolase [Ignavibacteria bacterium]|nr:MBL fold metallo-hydrolase [Ignavibacteria bacterium]
MHNIFLLALIGFLVLSAMGILYAMKTNGNDTLTAATGTATKESFTSIHKGNRFFNQVPWVQPPIFLNIKVIWEFFFSGKDLKPDYPIPTTRVNLETFLNPVNDQLSAFWLGHSTIMLNIDGTRIITDPVFERSISFFGPTRFNKSYPLDEKNVPEFDIAIISHNHYDHLNRYSIEILQNKVRHFIVPLGVGEYLRGWGVPENKIHELDWGETFISSTGTRITATPAQHFSGRGIFDRDETLWASWVIAGPKHNVFFSGDGGYFSGFKQIGETFGPFDLSFIECGAYNENWHHIHMYPEESVQANIDVKGKIMIPIHNSSFKLAMHPWYEPMERAQKKAHDLNVTIAFPILGQLVSPDSILPTDSWWKNLQK